MVVANNVFVVVAAARARHRATVRARAIVPWTLSLWSKISSNLSLSLSLSRRNYRAPSCTRLEQTDLPNLTNDAQARPNADQFERHWTEQMKTNPDAPSIIGALRPMYKTQFYIAGAINAISAALQIFQPTLLKWLIVFVVSQQYGVAQEKWVRCRLFHAIQFRGI